MPIEFTKCELCGIIFANPNGEQTTCAKCRNEEPAFASSKDMLRLLKNLLRDSQARGVYLTITDLATQAHVTEDKVWHFIHTGEIDTASFNDPQVRDFVVKRRKELMKGKMPELDETPGERGTSRSRPSGFHLRVEDDKDK